MKTSHIITLILSVCVGTVDATQDTLADAVKRHKRHIENRIEREFSPVDLPDLVKSSELIVRAVVLDSGVTRLSKDERSLVTDFRLQVLEQFLSVRATKPGDTITVTKPGGEITIDGYKVISIESDFPSFRPNQEYILFLKLDDATGQYVVPYGAQGAFRNVAGVVEQVSRDTGKWNRERGRMPVAVFMQELGALTNPQ